MNRSIIASLLLLACSTAPLPLQASPLSDLMDQHDLGWMLGSWASTDGNVKLTYEYKLDKNAISIKFAAGDREAEGMTVLKPGTQESVYMAIDNHGGVSKGKWSDYQDHPLLTTTVTTKDQEIKMATEHIKVNADTMTVKVYRQTESGQPGEMLVELEMKRSK